MRLDRLKKFTTAELSDALDACGVEGALLHIKPIAPGLKLAGPAYTVRYLPYETKPADFQPAANYIDDVPKGAIVVIDNQGNEACTTWGGILTHAALKKQLGGVVVHGAVRDARFIQESRFPVFCQAVYMRSGKNRVYKAQEQIPVCINQVTVNPCDIIVGDDDGVINVPYHLLDEVLIKAQAIRQTETQIMAAVTDGMSLKAARKKFHYHKPWQD